MDSIQVAARELLGQWNKALSVLNTHQQLEQGLP